MPITLCCGSYDVHKSFLLRNKSESLDLKEFLGCFLAENGCRSASNKNNALYSWIKVNLDQTGFYRVMYSDELLAALRNVIEKKDLSATDRYGNRLFMHTHIRTHKLASL